MDSIEIQKLQNAMIEAGKRAFENKLVWANSGNISCRLNEIEMLITASNAYLGRMSEDDLISLNYLIEGDEHEKGPSIEYRIHSYIYRKRKDSKAVLHSQPIFTTLIACTNLELNPNLIPESVAYLKKIKRIPYHHPGSGSLARAVSEEASDCDVFILDNHGAVCIGNSLDETLLRTETLEMLCKLVVLSESNDIELKCLSDDIVIEFLNHLNDIK